MDKKRGAYFADGEGEDSLHIMAVTSGTLISIEDVPDDVFSQKMVGDGFAIQPESDEIVAPVAGTLIRIADACHAFYIELNKELKVMVHVGINTLMLNGEGFHTDWESGVNIEAGEPLLSVDRKFLEEKGYNPIVSVVILDSSQGGYEYAFTENKTVKAGETVALTLHKVQP